MKNCWCLSFEARSRMIFFPSFSPGVFTHTKTLAPVINILKDGADINIKTKIKLNKCKQTETYS